ncbi:MAG: DUF4129 domain-containing protein [Gemmatimonadaceae bacterium]|nr:DUF4129 domain-containing protein [Gemmatimonadaceae bacterium]
MLLQSPIPAAAIRDTISRIVLERGYQRSVTSTLLARGWEWFSDLLGKLFRQAAGSRGTYVLSIILLTILVVTLIARSIIVSRARRLAATQRDALPTSADHLAQARALAAQGAYVEAAHLLHAAIVTHLVDTRRVRRHPSKTVGDYGRELRAVSDPLAKAYFAFASVYDVVAYGDGVCDSVRYARLEQLAAPMLQAAAPSLSRAA